MQIRVSEALLGVFILVILTGTEQQHVEELLSTAPFQASTLVPEESLVDESAIASVMEEAESLLQSDRRWKESDYDTKSGSAPLLTTYHHGRKAYRSINSVDNPKVAKLIPGIVGMRTATKNSLGKDMTTGGRTYKKSFLKKHGYIADSSWIDRKGHLYLGPNRRRVGTGFGRRRRTLALPAGERAKLRLSKKKLLAPAKIKVPVKTKKKSSFKLGGARDPSMGVPPTPAPTPKVYAPGATRKTRNALARKVVADMKATAEAKARESLKKKHIKLKNFKKHEKKKGGGKRAGKGGKKKKGDRRHKQGNGKKKHLDRLASALKRQVRKDRRKGHDRRLRADKRELRKVEAKRRHLKKKAELLF